MSAPATASAVLDVRPRLRAGRLIPPLDEIRGRIAGLKMDASVSEVDAENMGRRIAEVRKLLQDCLAILVPSPEQPGLFD